MDDPDFAELELVIVNFGRDDKGKRTVVEHRAGSMDLYAYDELNSMIDLTYRLWIEELTQRREDARKAVGGSTPMGF